MRQTPEDEIQDRLFSQISALDSIADVIRQALDSVNLRTNEAEK
jgi:hypothetical protein